MRDPIRKGKKDPLNDLGNPRFGPTEPFPDDADKSAREREEYLNGQWFYRPDITKENYRDMPDSWAKEVYDDWNREGKKRGQTHGPSEEQWRSKREGFYNLPDWRVDELLASGEMTPEQYERTKSKQRRDNEVPIMDEIRNALMKWQGSKNPKDWARIRLALGGFGVGGSMTKAKAVNPHSEITRKDLLRLGQELGLVDDKGAYSFGDKGVDELPDWGKDKMAYLVGGPGPDPMDDEDEDLDLKDPPVDTDRDSYNGLPAWRVGIFASMAHGTGWVDERGVFGDPGRYYGHFRLKKLWDEHPRWAVEREAWRKHNGFVEGEGWTEGPPPAGMGSVSDWFRRYATGEKDIDGKGMTREEFEARLEEDEKLQGDWNRWGPKHPDLVEPANPAGPPPDEGSTHLRGAPGDYSADREGQINAAIAKFEEMNVEGADQRDLIEQSRLIEHLIQGKGADGRTIDFDWNNITHNQKMAANRFTTNDAEGNPILGSRRQYDPWLWDKENDYRGTYGGDAGRFTEIDFERGQKFIGKAPPDEAKANTPRPIEHWQAWYDDLVKRGFMPSAIKAAAMSHWRPDYTTEEVEAMLNPPTEEVESETQADGLTDFTSGQLPHAETVGTTSTTSTGGDVGAYNPNARKAPDATQDYGTI